MKKTDLSKKKQYREFLCEAGLVALASALFAVSLNMFLMPGDIVVGGVAGIATVICHFFDVGAGAVIFLLNLPLILICLHTFGFRFCAKTIIGVVSISLASDFLVFLPISVTDPLLCSIFGAATMGLGVGILFSRGYTTGGTDMVVWLLKLRFRRLSTGKLIMLCDLAVIFSSALIFRDFEGLFYSVVTAIFLAIITDYTLSGSERVRVAMIVSEQCDTITKRIFSELGRGVTLFDAIGGYRGEEKKMLMCVVKRNELYSLRELVKLCDPEAFVIILSADEAIGEGFARSVQ